MFACHNPRTSSSSSINPINHFPPDFISPLTIPFRISLQNFMTLTITVTGARLGMRCGRALERCPMCGHASSIQSGGAFRRLKGTGHSKACVLSMTVLDFGDQAKIDTTQLVNELTYTQLPSIDPELLPLSCPLDLDQCSLGLFFDPNCRSLAPI